MKKTKKSEKSENFRGVVNVEKMSRFLCKSNKHLAKYHNSTIFAKNGEVNFIYPDRLRAKIKK